MLDQKNQKSGGASIGDLLSSGKIDPYKVATTAILVKFKIPKKMAEVLMGKGIREERQTFQKMEETKIRQAMEALKSTGVKSRTDVIGQVHYDAGKHFSQKNVNGQWILASLSREKFELQDAHLFQKSGDQLFMLNLTFEMKPVNLAIDPSIFENVFLRSYAEVHVWHNPDGKVTFNYAGATNEQARPVTIWEKDGVVFLR